MINFWGDYCELPAPSSGTWGLPDYRNPAEYGETRSWSHFRWRWEFMRRREDLRQDFDLLVLRDYLDQCDQAQLMRARGVPWPRTLAPCEPGFAAHTREPWKYGYIDIPNPRISEQPLRVLDTIWGHSNAPKYVEGRGCGRWVSGDEPGTERWEPRDEPGAGRWENGDEPGAHLGVPEGCIGALFDLDRPLRPQLQSAERALIYWQTKRHGKKKPQQKRARDDMSLKPAQKQARNDKWLLYLRALDAREAGLDPEEIGKVVPTTRGDGTKGARRQAATETLEAADNLRFNF